MDPGRAKAGGGGQTGNAKRALMVSLSNHALFAAFALTVVSSVTFAQQPERARTEALARRATERLQALQREADRLALEERTLLGDLRKLEIERQLRAEQLKQVDADAARVQAELDATAARIESLAAAERSEQIRDIDRRRDLNAQLAGELQVAQQKLQAALRELVNGAPAAETAALPLRPFRGDLEWPVNGVVKRRFGRGAAPNGIEIAAVEGAQALAVHDGVVAFAGTFAGFGNLVILDHGSQTFTLYGDLLEITVKKGARAEHG